MNDHQKVFGLKKDVVFQPMDDEAIIVSLESEEIYKLNITGAQIVKLVDENKSVQEIIAVLEEIYKIDVQDLENEVNNLLDELQSAGLIQEISIQ